MPGRRRHPVQLGDVVQGLFQVGGARQRFRVLGVMQESLVASKIHNGKKEGLIMRRQGRHQPLVYNSSPPVAFGEGHSLTLFNVTPEDSGSYECAVNAKIGGQNLNIRVELLVNGESGPQFFTLL